jgi:hypothetical protein
MILNFGFSSAPPLRSLRLCGELFHGDQDSPLRRRERRGGAEKDRL